VPKHAATLELLKAVSEALQGRSYVTLKLRSDDWAIPSVVTGLWPKTVKSSTVEVGQRFIPKSEVRYTNPRDRQLALNLVE
jgi:hypothetical protein